MILQDTDIRGALAHRRGMLEMGLRSRQRGFLMNPFRFGGGGGGSFPTSGLLAYYKLDGNANDSSGNGRNGTATGVSYVAGKTGNAGSFTTGTPSRIDLPSGAKPSSAYTFAAWLKPSTLTVPNGINVIWQDWVGTQRNFQLSIVGTTGRIELLNGNGGSLSDAAIGVNSALNTSNFVFVVAARTANTFKLFVNSSTPSATGVGSYSGGSTTNQSKIGADVPNSAGYGFGGLIDEAGIWNRELTASEIDYLYNGGTGVTFP